MKIRFKSLLVTCSLLLVLVALSGALYAASSVDSTTERTIAAKLEKNLVVVLTNDSGKLTPGENVLCVVIRNSRTGDAADVQNVSIDFAHRVGRILESSITMRLTR